MVTKRGTSPNTGPDEVWRDGLSGLLTAVLEETSAADADPLGLSDEDRALILDTVAGSPAAWDDTGEAALAVMDAKLTALIDGLTSAVLHHPAVAEARRRWAGVERLFAEPYLPPDFQLKLLHATRRGLLGQVRSAGGNVAKTKIYRRLVQQGHGVYGGTPDLVFDWDEVLGGGAADLAFADLAGRLAQAAMAISLLNAGPRFFGLDSFADLPTDTAGMRKLFTTQAMGGYADFRKQEHAKHVSFCLPGAYAVPPFHPDDNPAAGFDDFAERVEREAVLVPVAASALMTACVVRSVGQYGWPAAVVGEAFGGEVARLVARRFPTATGESKRNVATQMQIVEAVELPLAENGVTALVAKSGGTTACFFAGTTASRVMRGLDPKKSAASAMAASLPNMLVAVRFSHYLKMQLRRQLGGQAKPAELQGLLRSWANRFVLDQQDAGDAAKAARPFRKIEVRVQSNPDLPGYLTATVTLVPHYRVSAVSTTLVILPDADDESEA